MKRQPSVVEMDAFLYSNYKETTRDHFRWQITCSKKAKPVEDPVPHV